MKQIVIYVVVFDPIKILVGWIHQNTVFPRIISAETILFWKLKCGKYSREETIVFLLFVKKRISIDIALFRAI